MSHNGHLKTAICLRCRAGRSALSAARRIRHVDRKRSAKRWTPEEALRLHALAGHASLRKLPRRQLPAAQAPASGFLQRLRLLPLGRRSGRRDRRSRRKPAPARVVARANWTPCTQGRATHPVFVALGTDRTQKYGIPREPFADLIDAFVQDQTVTRYRDWDELFGYCRNSANPVGRLVLYLVRLFRRRAAAAFRRHLHRAATRQFLAGRDRRSAEGPRLYPARCDGAARLHAGPDRVARVQRRPFAR